MFGVLRRKYFIKAFFSACFLWAIAAAVLLYNKDNIKILLDKPVDINELAAEDIREGLRVKGSIGLIYDYYCYMEEDGKTISKEYLIPVGNKEYMGLACEGTDMEEADAVMQFYWDYLEQKELSSDSVKSMEIKGTIMPLEGESFSMYNQYIDQADWLKGQKKHFLPYIVMMGDIGTESKGGLIICALAFLALCAGGTAVFVKGIKGANLKTLEKYCSEKGDKEMYMRQIEDFYQAGIPVQGIRIDEQYFMGVKGASVFFAESRALLWIYKNEVRHSVNGIPTGKTYSVIIKKEDGGEFDIPMKNEAAANEAMVYVLQHLPYLLAGYDDELKNIFNKNRMEMVDIVEKRRQEYMGMSGGGLQTADRDGITE